MASYQTGDFVDLVNETLPAIKKNALTDLATDLRSYTACKKLLAKKREAVGGGKYYQIDFLTTGDGNARNVAYFEVANLDQVDGTGNGNVPWRYMRTGCHYDEKQLDVNQGWPAIKSFLKTKEYQMWLSWYELMEANFWDGPSSSSDVKTPFGLLKYWLTYNATVGFNGGNHANFTGGPASISASTYTRWKHFAGQYTNVTDDDLLLSMRKAVMKCRFEGIPNKPISGYSEDDLSYGIYTIDDVVLDMQSLLDSKSDGVRSDLAQFSGGTGPMFRGVPVEAVPYLTQNKATSCPVIGLNWNDIKVVHPSGQWLREKPYEEAPNQPDVYQRFVTASMNVVMHNRRSHFMFAKSDPTSA
jgi:hypothetical protein